MAEITGHRMPPVGVFTCSHCGMAFREGPEIWVGWFATGGQWVTTGAYHDGCVPLAVCRDRSNEARQVVNEQAEDEALWFKAQTITEAYLQEQLRRLHAAVERATGGETGPLVGAPAPAAERPHQEEEG